MASVSPPVNWTVYSDPSDRMVTLPMEHMVSRDRNVATTSDRLAAMGAMLQKGVAVPEERSVVPIPRPIVYSVQDKSRQLIGLLRGQRNTSLRALYAMAGSRSEVVATFLSLLTMCSMGSVTIDRDESNDYVVHFTGGDTEAILESMDYG